MGSTNFFSKLASVDPLAQALDLPGAHKYAQAQAQDVQTNAGPYAGTTPTLADANAGYAPGSADAQQGWTPNQTTAPGNSLFGHLQNIANVSGNLGTQPLAGRYTPTPMQGTNNTYVQGSQTVNPYITAARGAAQPQGSNIYG